MKELNATAVQQWHSRYASKHQGVGGSAIDGMLQSGDHIHAVACVQEERRKRRRRKRMRRR